MNMVLKVLNICIVTTHIFLETFSDAIFNTINVNLRTRSISSIISLLCCFHCCRSSTWTLFYLHFLQQFLRFCTFSCARFRCFHFYNNLIFYITRTSMTLNRYGFIRIGLVQIYNLLIRQDPKSNELRSS